MFLLFLRQKYLALRNTFTLQTVSRRAPFLVLVVGFWIFSYYASLKSLAYVRSIELFGEVIAAKLFSMIFFSLMGFLMLSNIITALSSFYLSRDLTFLFTRPIGLGHIVTLKTFESILNSSWMVVSFLPPILIAYGVSYHVTWIYYFLLAIGLFLFILITGGLGISAAHILAAVFPAERSRDVLLGAGLLLFLLIYFFLKSLVPQDISAPEEIINAFLGFKSDSPALPGFWLAQSLSPLLRHGEPGWFYMAVLFSNALFFMLISSSAGTRLYRSNFEKLQPSGRGAGGGILKNAYPRRSAAVMYKDTKTFFRDTGQWSQLLIIGALVMIYVYNFRSIPVKILAETSPLITELMVLINMLLAGLVLAAVAGRFVYSSVSLEGPAFWIVRTAPIDFGRFLWSKFFYSCVPLTALIVFLVFVTNSALHAGAVLNYCSAATALVLCLSVSGLGTGFGAIYPKFYYENIASVSMSIAGMAFMLTAFSLVVATLSLEALIYYLALIKPGPSGRIGFYDFAAIAASSAIILAVNSAALFMPMKLGIRKLKEAEVR